MVLSFLITGSYDGAAIVWALDSNEPIQEFQFNQGTVYDVDWKTRSSFACSAGDTVHVCEVGKLEPVEEFGGHPGDVVGIKWDPTKNLLASRFGKSAKIWRSNENRSIHDLNRPIHDLRGHTADIVAIMWRPMWTSTPNPNKELMLASASLDKHVKIWDVNTGTARNTLTHSESVRTLAFSPDGEYLASATSVDGYMHIWSIRDGECVKTYLTQDRIYQIDWNCTGDKFAICGGNRRVMVFDFRI